MLVLPTWYPNARRPDYSVFVRVQTQALNDAGAQVGMIFPEMREPRDLGSVRSILTNRFQMSAEYDAGYPVLRMHGWRLPKFHEQAARMFLSASQRLYRAYVARYGKPDIILSHTVINAGWAASKIAAREGLPHVIIEHSTHFARGLYPPAALERAGTAFAAADNVVAVSQPFADLLSRQFNTPIDAAPNAIDTGFFCPPTPARAPLKPSRPLRLAFVGTLDAKKGVDVLLEALRDLHWPGGVELRLIGEGPSKVTYEAQAADLIAEGRVKFLGPARQNEVRDLMHWADLFVLPSRFETFGVVVIEALATGLPVIATTCGGPESVVTKPEHGQLVPVGDATALEQAISGQAAALQSQTENLADIRHAYVTAQYGAQARAAAMLDRLRDVIARHAARSKP